MTHKKDVSFKIIKKWMSDGTAGRKWKIKEGFHDSNGDQIPV
jgi:hypothetical protein